VSSSALWLLLVSASVVFDVGASIYLKLAGDRIGGFGFFWAAAIGVFVFAPSIVMFGYALKVGPSYVATIGIWAVGVYVANACVGVLAFGDPFSSRTAFGVATACLTVILLKPA
jgi:multidrug transporter EmrE-like cation transporter